ncbi:SpoIIE family protein phosphatase [bacterium]|nr:SpoIIE family protein phosphatase [bacterium]
MKVELEIQPLSARLLVADDQAHVVAALEMLFRGEGYQVFSAPDPTSVLTALQEQTFDIILMDLNYTRDTTGGAEGLELVSRIRSLDRTIPLIVMTGWGNVEIAVEAMRRGATDFVQKPWNNSELLAKVQEQVKHGRVLRSSMRIQEQEALEAKEIQKNLLPRRVPQVAGYDIAANTQSVRCIGGDYYDIVQVSDAQTAFCIADVAGKGFPGALLMSNLQAALKPLIRADVRPDELCSRLNRALCEIMPANRFVSLFYGVLDSRKNLLTYCNAGHNPQLLLRAGGMTSELRSSGAILGRFPDWTYTQRKKNLSPGDILLLFTDGMVEACDENDEPFGEQRLLQITREADSCSAAAQLELLSKAVSAHCGGKLQDDATMIVLQAKWNSHKLEIC